MKSNRGKSEKITYMGKLVEWFPNFDFQDEEWDSWGYNCWLVFGDYMIIAFFHLPYRAL